MSETIYAQNSNAEAGRSNQLQRPDSSNVSKDTVRRGVLQLLKDDEQCRNNDLWLIFRYWREIEGVNVFIPFEKMAGMTAPETIRRIRAVIQNEEKKFLPTSPEVRVKRKISEFEWREWLGKAKFMFGLRR